MDQPIDNRVARSGLVTLDLEAIGPHPEIASLDIAPWLFEGLILREKEFRQQVDHHDWSAYSGKVVAVHCSTDAIVPSWAYMLIATRLAPHADCVVSGTVQEAQHFVWCKWLIGTFDAEHYRDKRVVIKGCGSNRVPPAIFPQLVVLLWPVVKSLMYGEPCSTVPLWKNK
ncbi:MAG: DUF2480 family protein [Salibacteraceae bacterium]